MIKFKSAPPNPELDALLRRAATYKMSPEELKEQRVSWVYGQLGHKSLRAKDEIRASLAEAGLI